MTERAKKKQASFSSMFKNVPNTNEASSSYSTLLLSKISGTSKAKKQTQLEFTCIFETKIII